MIMREVVCVLSSFTSGNGRYNVHLQRHRFLPLKGEEEKELDKISKNTTEPNTPG